MHIRCHANLWFNSTVINKVMKDTHSHIEKVMILYLCFNGGRSSVCLWEMWFRRNRDERNCDINALKLYFGVLREVTIFVRTSSQSLKQAKRDVILLASNCYWRETCGNQWSMRSASFCHFKYEIRFLCVLVTLLLLVQFCLDILAF
jgi:hypothetical protein